MNLGNLADGFNAILLCNIKGHVNVHSDTNNVFIATISKHWCERKKMLNLSFGVYCPHKYIDDKYDRKATEWTLLCWLKSLCIERKSTHNLTTFLSTECHANGNFHCVELSISTTEIEFFVWNAFSHSSFQRQCFECQAYIDCYCYC